MATIIIDLDGTCLKYHTNMWLPGVVEKLAQIAAAGHQVCFITMRGDADADQVWNGKDTEALLKKLPFQYALVMNSTWPRIVIDDYPPQAIQTATDSADWVGKFLR